MGASRLRGFALAFGLIAGASAISCGLLVDTSGLSGGPEPGTGVDAAAPTDGALADGPESPDGSTGVDAAADGGADASRVTYRDAVLLDGPIAYFRLADTAAVAKDETGAHDGTYVGGVDRGLAGPGPGAASVRFKNTGHVEANAVAMLPSGTFSKYTIEMFLASEVPAGTSSNFFAFSAANGGGGPVLFIDDATRTYRYTRVAVVDSTVAIGAAWHHLAITASGTTVSMYVDGNLDVSGNVPTIAPDKGALTIGANFYEVDGGTKYSSSFEGRMAEVAIYGKALTAAQIAAHYAARP